LRDSEIIAAQIAALGNGARTAGEFERGALAALRWLLEGGPRPITGEVGGRPTAARTIVQELAAAEALIYDPKSDPRFDQPDFARGVEHALMWAQFATCSAPAPPIPHQRGRGTTQPRSASVAAVAATDPRSSVGHTARDDDAPSENTEDGPGE
jgi:hypothetical protein